MNRTVAIINRLDVNNFGDVLLGRLFVDWLQEAQIRVICPGASAEVAKQMPLDAVGDYAEADAVIYIGGGYLSEPPGKLKHRIAWGNYLARTLVLPGIRALMARKPIAIISPGYGPITNPVARIGTLILFYLARICVLRDQESVRYLKKYGYFGKVVETADPALIMADLPLSPLSEKSRIAWLRKADGRKIILLNLTQNSMSIRGGDYIVNCLNRLMEDERYLFVAATDQAGTRSSKKTIDFYQKCFGGSDRCVLYAFESIDELIGLIEAASLAITAKLHVGMLAVARGTPVLSFPYHDKTLRFYRQAGLPNSCLPYRDWTRENIDRQFGQFQDLVNSEVALNPELIDKAWENKRIVQQFVTMVAGR